ncbi:MAG: LacI family DNA-binding transcriptional regulator [Ginsengibacter sp.]
MQKITISDIAKELNITAATVSRALNDHPAISESTTLAVKKMAKQLNYRQNRMASSLRSGKSHIWGVLIPSAKINFFGSVVHGIEKIASENGITTLLYQSGEKMENEIKGLDTFLRTGVDGIIASIARDTTTFDHYLEIKNQGIPLIFFDRTKDKLAIPAVVIDDYKGAFNATEHLIKQGCKNIAHISGPTHSEVFSNRLRGYKDALQKHHVELREDLILSGNLTIESGRECMNTFLDMNPRPDAIFAAEDFTALGAIQAMKERGINIPEEVAIMGFANEEFGKYITPALSTVDQQTVKMGETAAELLIKLSKQTNFYKDKPVKIVLEPEMIFRESSLKKKK